MKIVSEKNNFLVLRFNRGEEFISSLRRFCEQKRGIGCGFFHGLGGFTDPVIAYYDLKNKKYLAKKLRGTYEAAGLTGNISRSSDSAVIHCHVVVSGRNCRAFAGHLVSGKIAGTMEIFLTKLAGMKRKYDAGTGLNILA